MNDEEFEAIRREAMNALEALAGDYRRAASPIVRHLVELETLWGHTRRYIVPADHPLVKQILRADLDEANGVD